MMDITRKERAALDTVGKLMQRLCADGAYYVIIDLSEYREGATRVGMRAGPIEHSIFDSGPLSKTFTDVLDYVSGQTEAGREALAKKIEEKRAELAQLEEVDGFAYDGPGKPPRRMTFRLPIRFLANPPSAKP